MSKELAGYAQSRTPDEVWTTYLAEVQPGAQAYAAVEAAMAQQDERPEEA